MEYIINLPEIDKAELKLIVPKIFGKTKLYLNDFQIPKNNNRYSINNGNDKPILITLKNNYLDPVPKIFVNDNQVHVAKPIKWYEYIWTGLPILLILQGGLLGALMGFIALRLNVSIFRNDKSIFFKYLITLGISLAFVIVFLVIAILLNGLIDN